MSNLQIIEALCALVEQQADVIHHLAMELQHERTLTEAESQMVSNAQNEYSMILGANEAPDI